MTTFRELDRLKKLEADVTTTMPCGHPGRYMVKYAAGKEPAMTACALCALESSVQKAHTVEVENTTLRADNVALRIALISAREILEEHQPSWYLRRHFNLIEKALNGEKAESAP